MLVRSLSRPFAIAARQCSATASSNVDHNEVNKFNNEAARWWEEAATLRKLNGVRVPYIRSNLMSTLNVKSLNGISIVDVGCGGGFLSEVTFLDFPRF